MGPGGDHSPPLYEASTTSSSPSASSPPSPASPSSSSADPPPPLPDNDEPTPNEQLALDSWLRRNNSYIDTIPWHRYAALPVLSDLWGYSDVDFRHECLESLLFYTSACGRRLTDSERDALLEPITRSAVASRYDRPAALALGAWLVARSWRKTGARHQYQQHAAASAAAAAAAAAAGAGGGGHITHFSAPSPPHHVPQQQPHMAATARALAGSLARRAARASGVGLACAVGYYALSSPWQLLWGAVEVETIGMDRRLERMCLDMEQTIKEKTAAAMRRYGGGGWP